MNKKSNIYFIAAFIVVITMIAIVLTYLNLVNNIDNEQIILDNISTEKRKAVKIDRIIKTEDSYEIGYKYILSSSDKKIPDKFEIDIKDIKDEELISALKIDKMERDRYFVAMAVSIAVLIMACLILFNCCFDLM